jgi:GH15 family glucan-1,4-alpha-glucosidase
VYTVDGGLCPGEIELEHLAGYRGSRPVHVGNGATGQVQLDVYGAVLEAIWLFAQETGEIDVESGRAVAKIADWVCNHWRDPDSGIWEVRSEPEHFVQSKVMCWVALDRACMLAELGVLPDRRERWRAEAEAIRSQVDAEGWDGERGSYVRSYADRTLDASLLTLCLFDYDTDPQRIAGTVEAVRRELADGPLVTRYRGRDGLPGDEGHFLACSFWLVGALAKCRRLDEAAELMDELVALANDVGLYAEEVDRDGLFLGNFPQALSHLTLVNAAFAFQRAEAAA